MRDLAFTSQLLAIADAVEIETQLIGLTAQPLAFPLEIKSFTKSRFMISPFYLANKANSQSQCLPPAM
jgi:hypothetical protein